ncbi:MAG TPA: NAD-dependent epimerase/dehydratase family protein, partial [Eudoraea sp.]|nr:NAD-dependent epimerase/dehydratase family protein [Eudoraea sp.]
MDVLITGGGGFLGQRLARELLEHGGLVQGALSKLILLDKVFPRGRFHDPRVEYLEADFANEAVIDQVIARRPELIFHLAAIVSGEAEKNLDLGMQVNFRASMHLLEQCRSLEFSPRIVFTSSVAVYGGDTDKVITDETAARPRNSYGTQKAMVD